MKVFKPRELVNKKMLARICNPCPSGLPGQHEGRFVTFVLARIANPRQRN